MGQSHGPDPATAALGVITVDVRLPSLLPTCLRRQMGWFASVTTIRRLSGRHHPSRGAVYVAENSVTIGRHHDHRECRERRDAGMFTVSTFNQTNSVLSIFAPSIGNLQRDRPDAARNEYRISCRFSSAAATKRWTDISTRQAQRCSAGSAVAELLPRELSQQACMTRRPRLRSTAMTSHIRRRRRTESSR